MVKVEMVEVKMIKMVEMEEVVEVEMEMATEKGGVCWA
jgi:hypothetical protein